MDPFDRCRGSPVNVRLYCVYMCIHYITSRATITFNSDNECTFRPNNNKKYKKFKSVHHVVVLNEMLGESA